VRKHCLRRIVEPIFFSSTSQPTIHRHVSEVDTGHGAAKADARVHLKGRLKYTPRRFGTSIQGAALRLAGPCGRNP